MTKIDQRTIALLEGTGKRQFIRDSDLKGFGIEVSAKGKATYIVETRVKGTAKNVRRQIGGVALMPLDEARLEARRLLLEAYRGKDIRFSTDDEEALPETLGAALDEFVRTKKHRLSPSTIADYQKTFRNCLSDWKNLPTGQLSRKMVQERYLNLLENKRPAYVNKVFRNLSSVLSFSGVRPNPCEIIKDRDLYVGVEGRNRFLSAQEITLIQPKEVGSIENLVVFYMLTGLRRNEALEILWSDIHDGGIHIRNTKNKKSHTIPLVGILKDLIGPRGEENKKVFPFTDASLRTALERLKYRVNFKQDWTIHDLRRTFSEHLNLIGYTESDIALANNQSSTNVTGRHYLSRQLAKQQLLARMYTDLQKQFQWYWQEQVHEFGLSPIMKAPEGWKRSDPGKYVGLDEVP